MGTTAHHGKAPAGKPTYFTCSTHRKLSYPKRAEARAAARRLHDPGLREYACSTYPGCWHIGHIPLSVRRGEMTATEFYALSKRQQARLWVLETTQAPDSGESGAC